MEDDSIADEILCTVDTVADYLIYTEKAFKSHLEECDERPIFSKIAASTAEMRELDETLEEQIDECLKRMDSGLQKREELLKDRQQKQDKLKAEFKHKQDYVKECQKTINSLKNKIEALEKEKEAFSNQKSKILTYKIITNTTFDFKMGIACGYITGPNEKIEPFSFPVDNSKEKIAQTLWQKVKEVNELH